MTEPRHAMHALRSLRCCRCCMCCIGHVRHPVCLSRLGHVCVTVCLVCLDTSLQNTLTNSQMRKPDHLYYANQKTKG